MRGVEVEDRFFGLNSGGENQLSANRGGQENTES
jgi:hypothetical protein